MARLRDAWENLARQKVDAETVACPWPSVVAILFLCGAGFGLLRLGVSLWSVSRYRRRSRGIIAAVPRDLLASLQRTMNCPGRVEVRESPDLSTPVTIGWRRPLILLPAGWRDWTEDELHAVLAHELAHVRRWDYATCLLARISLAVHFYHPLAYWLVGRLQLQQELAADAFAVVCLGGRKRYLRVLAQLLLREDARPPCWPARAFLSPSGTLLRRIDMLRVKDGSRQQKLPRSTVAVLALVLALAGVGVSALRGPAQQSENIRIDVQETNTGSLIFGVGVNSNSGLTGQIVLNERNFDVLSPSADKPSRPVPFDLAYVNPDAPGMLAVRPAAFLRRPGMGLFAALAKEQFASILDIFGIPKDAAPSIDAIEQAIGEARLSYNEKAPKGQRNQLVITLTMIRTEKPFDWKKRMQTLMPGAEKVRYGEKTYYKGKLQAMGMKLDLCCFFPDGRTVVFHREKAMRRVLDNLAGGRAALPWAGDWQRVERGLMALALDTRRMRKVVKELPDDIAPLMEHAAHLVVGVDVNDYFDVRAFAECADEKSAETLVEWARTQLTQASAALDLKERDKRNPIADRLAGDLLNQSRIRRHGTKASLRTRTKITSADLEMLASFAASSK